MKKMKAVTFSYDDGVLQDARLIELFNRYGLKCTFNINSGTLGQSGSLIRDGATVGHNKFRPEEVREIYRGHEIAGHSRTHPTLKELTDEQLIDELEGDRRVLSELAGYEVIGFAYPGGTDCMNAHVADVIRTRTGIRYARTTTSTHNFDLQEDLIVFNPTVYHHAEFDRMFEIARDFLALKTDRPQVLYIWGHAYEFDIADTWGRFEELCQMLSGHEDIYYGTNREVLLERFWEK